MIPHCCPENKYLKYGVSSEFDNSSFTEIWIFSLPIIFYYLTFSTSCCYQRNIIILRHLLHIPNRTPFLVLRCPFTLNAGRNDLHVFSTGHSLGHKANLRNCLSSCCWGSNIKYLLSNQFSPSEFTMTLSNLSSLKSQSNYVVNISWFRFNLGVVYPNSVLIMKLAHLMLQQATHFLWV